MKKEEVENILDWMIVYPMLGLIIIYFLLTNMKNEMTTPEKLR